MAAKKRRVPSPRKKNPPSAGPKRTRNSETESERAAQPPTRRNCGTMSNHMKLLETYPSFRSKLFALEEQTARFRSAGLRIGDLPVATIRVVVNVVYHDDSQNISDAQIKSQIAALNKDFRAKNTDKSKTPTAFKGLV